VQIDKLRKKVKNRKMSQVQMENVKDLMAKTRGGKKLGLFEYCVVLVNDEKGAGRWVQRLFLFAIFLSLAMQIMSDLAFFTPRGDDSVACGLRVRPLCQALQDSVIDMKNVALPVEGATIPPAIEVPIGCLVQSEVVDVTEPLVHFDWTPEDESVTEPPLAHFKWTTNASEIDAMSALFLDYECDEDTCFGARSPEYTCGDSPQTLPENSCVHPKCAQGEELVVDLSPAFFYVDLVVAVIFTLEIMTSYVFLHATAKSFFRSKWTWIDAMATIPSIITICLAIKTGTISTYYAQSYFGTAYIGSFIQSGFFAVVRFFKVFKHIPEVAVLSNTFLKVADQLILVYAFMMVVVVMFAFVLFYLESGRVCFFDVDGTIDNEDQRYQQYHSGFTDKSLACTPVDQAMLLQSYESGALASQPVHGERFQIDDEGEITQFPDIFVCMWFFVVTVTSVGYGDISPITSPGKAVGILGMLFGAVYIAMPLSLVGGEYFSLWREYTKHVRDAKEGGNISMDKLELSHDQCRAFNIWCNSLICLDRVEEMLVSSNNGPNADTFLSRVSKVTKEQHKVMGPYFRLSAAILAIKGEGERQQEEKEILEND
jgi:hypothetical protein